MSERGGGITRGIPCDHAIAAVGQGLCDSDGVLPGAGLGNRVLGRINRVATNAQADLGAGFGRETDHRRAVVSQPIAGGAAVGVNGGDGAFGWGLRIQCEAERSRRAGIAS